jgi:hypothetical protein
MEPRDKAGAKNQYRTFVKRWLFRLVLLAGLYAFLEGGSLLAYRISFGERFHFSKIRHMQSRVRFDVAKSLDPKKTKNLFEIHPYLGAATNPTFPEKILEDDPITDWGFTGKVNKPPVRKRAKNKVIVGIAGASVASIFSAQGVKALERELKQSATFSGKDFEFVNIAIGTQKQPQHLLSLVYSLVLGGEFDILVNLDGFNDVAWYPHENRRLGIHPIFPVGWMWRIGVMDDPGIRRMVGQLANLEENRADWARISRNGIMRRSIFCQYLWRVRDQRLASEIGRLRVDLANHKPDNLHYRLTGPPQSFSTDEEMYDYLADIWQRSSLQLDRLCRANGIRYFHFLQPNQYLSGSKRLSEKELKEAFTSHHPARPNVEKGYPVLREAGKQLTKKGVRFRDLSLVFKDHQDTYYFDNCCHFNKKGCEVLAAAMAQFILETPEPPRQALRMPAGPERGTVR